MDVPLIDPNADSKRVRNWIRQSVMPAHPEWNALVEQPAAWFRVGIKRIDHLLTLQFMPPRCDDFPGGVNPAIFPGGVWAVFRRLPLSGWLRSTWVYALYNQYGGYQPPDGSALHMIRMARNLYLKNQGHRLDQYLDEACVGVAKEDNRRARNLRMNMVADRLRSLGLTQSMFKTRMTVPAIPRG